MDSEAVRHDGRETQYWVDEDPGDGPLVLFVHGSGCRSEVWVEQMDREGATAAAVDLSGHGDSEDIGTEAGPETMRAYARDVEAAAREVEADVLVGHSLGGAVVQTQLLDGEYTPAGAVLAGTGAKLGVGPSLEGALGGPIDPVVSFMRQHNILFHDDEHEDLEQALDIIRTEGMAMLRRDLLSCNQFDVRDRLVEISVPCLCIVGSKDKLTPTKLSSYLAENIPDAEYAEVPAAAHMAMMEQPATFNESLDEFVTSL
jgi:3-oxoadipate enol-lactonase